MAYRLLYTVFLASVAFSTAANAQSPAPASEKAQDASPSLVIYFGLGSSKVQPKDNSILDKASRTFNEGKPIVMIISGSSDRSGDPKNNLTLSQRRVNSVLHALTDRGIPINRFQLLAKGETELPVATAAGVAEKGNRRVVITWR